MQITKDIRKAMEWLKAELRWRLHPVNSPYASVREMVERKIDEAFEDVMEDG